jgi:hypothetical protein
MVRRVLGLLAVVLVASLPSPASAASESGGYAVPTAIPPGWYVIGARPAAPSSSAGGYRFYARDLHDGPALAVGRIDCDGGCDRLVGRPRAVPGPRDATLTRHGPYTWVMWPDASGSQDLGDVVITRNLSDDEAIAAARATRGSDGHPLRIAKTGLPDGVRDRGEVAVGPGAIPDHTEELTLLSGPPGRTIELYSWQPNAANGGAQQFFADQDSRMTHDFAKPVVGDFTAQRSVVVTGAVGRAQLEQLGRSVQLVDSSSWNAFRARVRDVPAAVLLPGLDASTGYAVLDGSTDTTRWVAAFKPDGDTVTAYTALVDVDVGEVVGGSALQPFAVDAVTTLARSAQPQAGLVTGVVPAGTASVRYEGTGTPPIAAQASDLGPGSDTRYFAQLLPVFPTAIVALDANGLEIART